MDSLPLLIEEMTKEYNTTKKFLAIFPAGENEYAPHEKSMKMMPLASHIAEIFAWPEIISTTEVMDFAKGDYKPAVTHNKQELLEKLEESYKIGMHALHKMEEKDLEPSWSIANDGHTLASWTRYGAIRHGLSQVCHHRAQLGVYYRLLDIPLPGSYGPSADDQNFS